MDSPDASWAPQSPDLSTYHAADTEPIHPQHQAYRGSISHASPTASSSPSFDRRAGMPRAKKGGSADDIEGDGVMKGGVEGVEGISISTKFPVARIKRIMQADDDVGKVAQVTPVVVSKALELFMISLVTKAAAEAKARNSKRVATTHLKQAVTKDEQFDFLSEIVGKIADAPAAQKEEDGEGRKRKGVGRRKKKSDDEDF